MIDTYAWVDPWAQRDTDAHTIHVLVDAVSKTVRGERTLEQLREWWIGPLVKTGDTK